MLEPFFYALFCLKCVAKNAKWCCLCVFRKCGAMWDADNAEWYCKRRQPFVMGTTGGDRAKLMQDVEESKVYSVIAAQMGKQVGKSTTACAQLLNNEPTSSA